MTGSVLDRPRSVEDAADEIALLLADPNRLRAMGEESRRRAVTAFTHDALAARLGEALSQPVERSVR
jgi:glycosyltransferase involved in cell wall biosynthesis